MRKILRFVMIHTFRKTYPQGDAYGHMWMLSTHQEGEPSFSPVDAHVIHSLSTQGGG